MGKNFDVLRDENSWKDYHWNSLGVVINPFLIIKNKQQFTSSEGFSALEKNVVICSQKVMLPIQLGVKALCR